MLNEDEKLKIEFVILTWNSIAYIDKCIESILSFVNYQVVIHVIDNGSVDGTAQRLDVLAKSAHGRMNVVKVGINLGTTVSRNIALRSIGNDTDYVCILDSDTIVNEHAFESMVDALDTHPDIGIIGPLMRSSSGSAQLSGRNLPTVGIKLRKAIPISSIAEKAGMSEIPSTPVVGGLQDVGYLLSACWLMPRRTLEEVGLFDEAIFYAPEDVDYCVRVHRSGRRVVYCSNAEIIHEYQRLSKKKLFSRLNLEHIKGLLYYFRKNRQYS